MVLLLLSLLLLLLGLLLASLAAPSTPLAAILAMIQADLECKSIRFEPLVDEGQHLEDGERHAHWRQWLFQRGFLHRILP
ncbi:MAG: hypothetical protein ABSA72_11535, partial [Nitrososphaerales archaeon]